MDFTKNSTKVCGMANRLKRSDLFWLLISASSMSPADLVLPSAKVSVVAMAPRVSHVPIAKTSPIPLVIPACSPQDPTDVPVDCAFRSVE